MATVRNVFLSTVLSTSLGIALSSCGGGGGSSGGNGGSGTTDRTSPVVSFSPSTLSVGTGGTARSTLTATDNVGITSGPTVSCTNGGSFADNVFTAPSTQTDLTSVCTATARDAAGNTGSATLTVNVDATPLTVKATINGENVIDKTTSVDDLTTIELVLVAENATALTVSQASGVDIDFLGVSTSNPASTNFTFRILDDDKNQTVSGLLGTFTVRIELPDVEATSEVVIDLLVSDGDTSKTEKVTLSIADVNTAVPESAYFKTVSDTISTDPVMGMIDVANSSKLLVGFTKNSGNGSVSTFSAAASATGVFDDAIITAEPSYGTIGTPPMTLFRSQLSSLESDKQDFVIVDDVNEELIGVSVGYTQLSGGKSQVVVPGLCSAGPGVRTNVIVPGIDTFRRNDILAGTTNGLYLVEAGFSSGPSTSGLSQPKLIVETGNFCHLLVGQRLTATSFATIDPSTRKIDAFRGVTTPQPMFTIDLSSIVSADMTPVLIDGDLDVTGRIISVFSDKQNGGSVLIISVPGSTPNNVAIKLDMDSPTDIALFARGYEDDLIVVDPTSSQAIYVRDFGSTFRSVEAINVGTGFDQVQLAGGAIAFASSTTGDIEVRKLQ